MTWQPTKLTIEEFEARVRAFPWAGRVISLHPHHTTNYKSAWKGRASIAMLYHAHVDPPRYVNGVNVGGRGWRDFGQHVTLDPFGDVWLGRSWNDAPASATGHNGHDNRDRPFMIEVFSNFQGDATHAPDILEGKQRESLVRIIAAVQAHFGLPADALMFHREMGATACPGKISKTELISSVTTYRRDSGASHSSTEPTPDSPPAA